MMAGALDGVGEGVTEIQMRALAVLQRVGFNHAGLDPHVVGDEFGQCVDVEIEDRIAGFPAGLLERSGGSVALEIRDGSLCVRSGRTALRYLGSDKELKDDRGFIDTGDLVEVREDRYHFVGRRSTSKAKTPLSTLSWKSCPLRKGVVTGVLRSAWAFSR